MQYLLAQQTFGMRWVHPDLSGRFGVFIQGEANGTVNGHYVELELDEQNLNVTVHVYGSPSHLALVNLRRLIAEKISEEEVGHEKLSELTMAIVVHVDKETDGYRVAQNDTMDAIATTIQWVDDTNRESMGKLRAKEAVERCASSSHGFYRIPYTPKEHKIEYRERFQCLKEIHYLQQRLKSMDTIAAHG